MFLIAIWMGMRQFIGRVSPAGVSAPLRLRWVDKDTPPTGIVFTWDAPVSFGPGPRRPQRYQLDYRHGADADSTAFPSAAPFLVSPEYTDSTTHEVSDGAGRNDSFVRFRVRAGDSDGNWSPWLTSPALNYEGARPAGRHGPFSRQFSGAFA